MSQPTHELCQYKDCPKKVTHKIETRNKYLYYCRTHVSLFVVEHPVSKGVVIEISTGKPISLFNWGVERKAEE